MILGQTRNYILGIAGMLFISIWSPNKLAYTEPIHCCDVIDNSLVFNSTILRLTAQYDSSEQIIASKIALVDSQSRVISHNLKKLKNDNNNQDLVSGSRDSYYHLDSNLPKGMQQFSLFYFSGGAIYTGQSYYYNKGQWSYNQATRVVNSPVSGHNRSLTGLLR